MPLQRGPVLVLPSVVAEYLPVPPVFLQMAAGSEDGAPAWGSHQTWIQTPLHPCESSLGIFSTSSCLRFSSHLKCGESSSSLSSVVHIPVAEFRRARDQRAGLGGVAPFSGPFPGPFLPNMVLLTFKQATSFKLSVPSTLPDRTHTECVFCL